MRREKIRYKYSEISYTRTGEQGKCLIFLHGYLANLNVWDSFVSMGFEAYSVLQIDLPGHGQSGTPEETSIEEMAQAVLAVLDAEGIETACFLGHSMGGYVVLAIADLFPERVANFALIHSTAFPDTTEKKAARDSALKLIQTGKKNLLISTAVPMTFANQNQTKFKTEIETLVQQAQETSNQGIAFALQAMRDRPDRSHVLKTIKCPYLLVIGEQDSCVPYESSVKQLYWSHKSKHVMLKNSGHTGFIEQKEELRVALLAFLTASFV